VLKSFTVVISRQICIARKNVRACRAEFGEYYVYSVVSYYSWNKHPLFDSSRNEKMSRRKQCKNLSDHILAVWWSGSVRSVNLQTCRIHINLFGNRKWTKLPSWSFLQELSSLISAGSISLDSTGTFKDQHLTYLGDEEEALLADILHIWGALHDGFHSGQGQHIIFKP
jgi:hypothetical protein